MTDLSSLIERIEKSEGADREIDLAIAVALDMRPDWLAKSGGELWIDRSGAYPVLRWADASAGRSRGNPGVDDPVKFTASMDAVRSLIDPNDEWELTTLYGVARATVGLNRDHQTSWPGYGEHQGGDPVRALLSAALKARNPSHEG
ncbi:hypothetical protein [Sphingopyxis sp. MG]|uniref:hypothetical protein n=1 Tax=Sphingopyxis sp. MG TaxID=1866325 RepID=UPI000CDF3482|nr:hypothetical protein [Sphingopyxis sp. MG]AVA13838.1 hypothetical protein C3E99_08320 [Sphingopyxis sp. MG]